MRQNLINLVTESGLTQQQLGHKVGILQPTLNRIMNDIDREPAFSSMLRLANYFNVAVETLYESREEYKYKPPLENNVMLEDKVISVPVSKTITVEIKIT